MIEVMQAFDRGEHIQYRNHSDNVWQETICINWNWNSCDYRVKPKEEKKQPTHLEIMTKWWKIENIWTKVFAYNSYLDKYTIITNMTIGGTLKYLIITMASFSDMQSADIPPKE